MFDLRSDPFERADITSNSYYDWFMSNAAPFLASQSVVAPFLATFKDYPPSQRSGSMNLDQVMDMLASGATGAGK